MVKRLFIIAALLFIFCQEDIVNASGAMERIGISPDGRGFVCLPSGRAFHPWGNNYGCAAQLIEDFWGTNWSMVARNFQEMKDMGANVVRVHLQFDRFMPNPDQPNPESLDRLSQLLQLAEEDGLYLDITGLACYRQADVPAWYDALSDARRWDAQARFWEAIATRCASSRAVFCYDLINEPAVTGDDRKPGDWYFGELGGYNFCQFINLKQGNRPREEIARQWIEFLTRAIRKQDRSRLITVGLLPTTPGGGCLSGFQVKTIAPALDFISVHIYPEKGKVKDAMAVLRQFAVGKPVVIEETFPLTCSVPELRDFLLKSRRHACGWIGHYNGETIPQLEALQKSGKISAGQSLWLGWMKLFKELGPAMNTSHG